MKIPNYSSGNPGKHISLTHLKYENYLNQTMSRKKLDICTLDRKTKKLFSAQ